MTWHQHQNQIETNARRLDRAQRLLQQAHLQFILLGDVMAAYRVNRIINSVHAQRQRWLHTAGSPLP